MNGEVIYFDAERGTGFIAGRDGNRYVFDRADIEGGDGLDKGVRVEFVATGDRARGIRPLDRLERGSAILSAPPAGARAAGAVPAAGGMAGISPAPLPARPESGDAPGPLGYFRRAVTVNYSNFAGRARRKEFWSFALIAIAVILVALFSGLVLDFSSGNMREIATDADFAADGAPIYTFIFGGVAWLVLIVPSLAVTVRRIHDIGLSGWFILLNFAPSIGTLIVLVFTLIPSQIRTNQWGPVPAGVSD